MRPILTFIVFVFLTSNAFSQSCPSSLTILSQQDLNDFAMDYPSCTHITVDVFISGVDITNLTPLLGIDTIQGDLTIQNCSSLASLAGLDSLKYVGDNFTLRNIALLSSLDGLENLTFLNGDLALRDLTSLATLTALSSISGAIGNFNIQNCHQLTNLIGLEGISAVGFFSIFNNDGLLSLNGLNGIMEIQPSVGFALNIRFNDALIDLTGLDNLMSFNPDDNAGVVFQIADNNQLVNLNALSSLQILNGDLTIDDNDLLSDISGLNNVVIGNNFDVLFRDNNSLSDCAITPVCDLIASSPGEAIILSNAVGCNSEPEVDAACTALPLQWIAPLEARQVSSAIELSWSVSNQVNNDYFQIERSTNGVTFQNIGKIKGEIDWPENKAYHYIDANSHSGNNYYRVGQFDAHGENTYSNITSVRTIDSEVQIFPNPATSILYIASETQGPIFIYNCFGQMQFKKIKSDYQIEIDISSLPNGLYYLRFENGECLSFNVLK